MPREATSCTTSAGLRLKYLSLSPSACELVPHLQCTVEEKWDVELCHGVAVSLVAFFVMK